MKKKISNLHFDCISLNSLSKEMRVSISILFYFCAVISLQAQSPGPETKVEDYIELSSDPKSGEVPCEQRTIPGSTITLWDWRSDQFWIHYYGSNQNDVISRLVDSPFAITGSAISSPNTAFLAFDQDYEPTDGWELLYRDFGTPSAPAWEPSFALYNRYSSLVRVFFWIEPNFGQPNNALISATNELSSINPNFENNAIFENLNIPQKALENFTGGGFVSQWNTQYINGTWLLLEFPTSYDPCVCLHESAIEFTPTLTQITEGNFEITGSSTSEAIYPDSPDGNILGDIADANGKIQKGFKLFKDLNDLVDKLSKSKVKTVASVGKVASWYPPVAGVINVLDLFIASDKSSRLIGFNTEYEFDVNGTLITPTNYIPTGIYTPGSFFNVNNPQSLRPVYDNPLGLFTILETPKVEVAKGYLPGELNYLYFGAFTFLGDLKYAYNVDAGIVGVTKLSAALVWKDCNGDSTTVSSPFIDIDCLPDFTQKVLKKVPNAPTGPFPFTGCLDEPKLQLIAVMSDIDGGEIMYTAEYEVEVVPASQPYSEELISDPNSFSCESPVPASVSDEELQDFCRSKYDPSKLGFAPPSNPIFPSFLNKTENIIDPDVQAFPNPFVTYFSFKIDKNLANQDLQVSLTNIYGQIVWKEYISYAIQGYYTFSNHIADLPSGTYFLNIEGSSENKQLTLIKQ